MTKRLSAVFTSGALVGVIAMLVGRALAGGIPSAALHYAGKLEDDSGHALGGEHAIQINFWDSDEAQDTPLCQTASETVKLAGGRFSLTLPERCTDAIKEHPNVEVELLLNGVPTAKRKLGAVPFAIESGHALSADAASGGLRAALEELDRKKRAVSAIDMRDACPPKAAANTDLLTVNFQLDTEATVHLTGNMPRNFNGRADLELWVDGSRRNIAITYTNVMAWVGGHSEWTGTLPAGDHVASLRSPTPDAWGCRRTHGSTLTALIFE
jgi:hypothetical protein